MFELKLIIYILVAINAILFYFWIRKDVVQQRNYEIYIRNEKGQIKRANFHKKNYRDLIVHFDKFLHDNGFKEHFKEWADVECENKPVLNKELK